jgi:undecaprenyl-phosphate 4-deoxy-4-formamido-L-arabinose transferase
MRATGRRFEAVFVNDGSADSSWAEIEKLSRDNPWLRGIDLMRNSGQENALLCGIRAARMELIATIDDDLQNPPEEIGRLAEKLEGGRVGCGVWDAGARERHGIWRDTASVMTSS